MRIDVLSFLVLCVCGKTPFHTPSKMTHHTALIRIIHDGAVYVMLICICVDDGFFGISLRYDCIVCDRDEERQIFQVRFS